MSEPKSSLIDRVGQAARPWTPKAYRLRRLAETWMRRAMHKPRTVAEGPNLLPLLIKVLAAFSKVDGQVMEEEIDSILGFLRYDYPEAVYSELRKLFRQALNEHQDLTAMAARLSAQLSPDRKIMLGVQLYDLISKAGLSQEQVVSYYSFMAQLGMAAQAIDIVYQLNATDEETASLYQRGSSPLESLSFGRSGSADVILKGLEPEDRLLAFRYQDLILLKNNASRSIVARGRPMAKGAFCRVYPGQRIVLGEQVLTYQDLVYYFNAKKNVSISQIYLAGGKDGEFALEKARTRDTALEIQFALKVHVHSLQNVDGTLNGRRLRAGVRIDAALEDKIIFDNRSELPLQDLRRRARAMGGRFQLQTHKSKYLVSNNSNLLEEDDILLSPGSGGDVLLEIHCDYDNRVGELRVLKADRPIMIGDTPVRNSAPLKDGDAIRIDTGQLLRCDFSERILEEERNIIRTLDVQDVTHHFSTGTLGMDAISFHVSRGEMVCVMGASGSGKSTLMKTVAGQIHPEAGDVLLNGQSLYRDHELLKRYVSYIPQEDAFDEHLTIEENLDFAAAIRAPHLSNRDRNRRVEGKLLELGLVERKNSIVGSPHRKTLSGGERKRLNIGLDMIGQSDVYLFDEPTSGLSSKDSEHVIEIIRGLAHNKIILVTIHQPTSKIFQMFNKAILLDRGGRLVFFGTPSEMLAYFAKAEHEQHFGTELGGCPACGTTRPEFIFDVLETPLRDLSGDIIYEENNSGQLVPARRFSPEYWRDKWESVRLVQDVRQVAVKKPVPAEVPPTPTHHHEKIRWGDEWTQLKILILRAFKSKLRNRANLLTSIVEAPLLGALIGGVLRYSESGAYTFATAYHIPTYMFLALVVAMFLGLTNSADDIIRDRAVLQRERNLNVRLPYYISAKALALGVFAALQCLLFVLIGNAILEIRGMFWIYFLALFLTALGGISIGLFISSLVDDAKTAANIVPLVLIPQIILGGALIKYEEMNKNLDFVYTMSRWMETQPGENAMEERSELEVPFVCQLMPMRWSYEMLVVAQGKLNPLTKRQEQVQKQIEALLKSKESSPALSDRLYDLKETLAFLSGLSGERPRNIDKRLERIDEVLAGAPLEVNKLRSKSANFTAEGLFVNRKVVDLVAKSETEQLDYRRQKPINVFFGPVKYFRAPQPILFLKRLFVNGKLEFEALWAPRSARVFTVNTFVLIGFAVVFLGLLHFSLRRQLRV